jgi:hypothetical protein
VFLSVVPRISAAPIRTEAGRRPRRKSRRQSPTEDPLSWTSVSGNFLTKLPGKERKSGSKAGSRKLENPCSSRIFVLGLPGITRVGALPKLDVAGSTPVARSTLSPVEMSGFRSFASGESPKHLYPTRDASGPHRSTVYPDEDQSVDVPGHTRDPDLGLRTTTCCRRISGKLEALSDHLYEGSWRKACARSLVGSLVTMMQKTE